MLPSRARAHSSAVALVWSMVTSTPPPASSNVTPMTSSGAPGTAFERTSRRPSSTSRKVPPSGYRPPSGPSSTHFHRPPTRTSSSALPSSAPNHACHSAAVVYASQARAAVASMTRETR